MESLNLIKDLLVDMHKIDGRDNREGIILRIDYEVNKVLSIFEMGIMRKKEQNYKDYISLLHSLTEATLWTFELVDSDDQEDLKLFISKVSRLKIRLLSTSAVYKHKSRIINNFIYMIVTLELFQFQIRWLYLKQDIDSLIPSTKTAIEILRKNMSEHLRLDEIEYPYANNVIIPEVLDLLD
jgi:hypothetical protein